MKDKETALCYKSTATDILGITVGEFDKLNIPVAETVDNPHHKSSRAYLYNRKLIQRYAKRRSIIRIRERLSLLRAKRESNKEANRVKMEMRLAKAEEIRRQEAERKAELAKQEEIKRHQDYSSKYLTLQDALPYAAKAMLNLNRFVKHEDCDRGTRASIYSLKNRFVKLLYHNGYLTGASKHILKTEEKECWSCGGTGIRDSGNDCNRCEGTGIYREAQDIIYVLLQFNINGTKYSWHQPGRLIDFDVTYTAPNADMPDIGVKPLEIPESQLSEASWLVKWVVEKWGKDIQLEKAG